jgi:hypothetical protein
MLLSRLRRQFVIFAIALFAAGHVGPYSRGQNIANPACAASFQTSMLRQVSRKAGFIFSGTAVSVVLVRGASDTMDTVQITFAVHEGVRGVRPGKTFTMQEWAGLWSTESGRFRRGDRVFLFLYPRSKLGLTSVVGATLGRYDLDSNWRIAGKNQQPQVLLDESQPPRGSRPPPRGNVRSRDLANIIRGLTE